MPPNEAQTVQMLQAQVQSLVARLHEKDLADARKEAMSQSLYSDRSDVPTPKMVRAVPF